MKNDAGYLANYFVSVPYLSDSDRCVDVFELPPGVYSVIECARACEGERFPVKKLR